MAMRGSVHPVGSEKLRRRPINSKLRIFWDSTTYEYVATISLLSGVRGSGKTMEKALLSLSMDMKERVEGIIMSGNNI